MVVCLEQYADLHTAQLMPLQLTVSCFSKIQIDFTFLVPAHLLNGCVCVCVLAYGGGHEKEDVERGFSLLFICSYCLLPLTFTANCITPCHLPLHFVKLLSLIHRDYLCMVIKFYQILGVCD